MKIFKPYSELVATTLSGLESVCADEIAELGGKEPEVLSRAVRFTGSKEEVYRMNYSCRTALRILMPLAEFRVNGMEDFYGQIRQLGWEQWMEADQTLAIESVGSHPLFPNTMFASQKAKDAIADRFRERCNRRPSVDLDNAQIRIHVHLHPDQVRISLDSSGTPLFKRGYRMASVQAPLNEVLAAGLIRLSDWDGEMPFFDPFCGSGTLAIEAAMIRSRRPAGSFRKNWSLMNWSDFDKPLWEKTVQEAKSDILPLNTEIHASDIDAGNLNVARRNISAAGLEGQITTTRSAFENFPFPDRPGFILTNPPYGERLREFDQISFYKGLGNVLKKNCPAYQAWILGSDANAMKFIGLKPDKKFNVYNGQLACRFMKYSLFSGKRKDHLSQ